MDKSLAELCHESCRRVFRASFRPMRDGVGVRYAAKSGTTYLVLYRKQRRDYVWAINKAGRMEFSESFFRSEEEALKNLVEHVFRWQGMR